MSSGLGSHDSSTNESDTLLELAADCTKLKTQRMQKSLDNVRFNIIQKARWRGRGMPKKALFKLRTSTHHNLLEELFFVGVSSFLNYLGENPRKRGRSWKSGLCRHVDLKKKMFLETKEHLMLHVWRLSDLGPEYLLYRVDIKYVLVSFDGPISSQELACTLL